MSDDNNRCLICVEIAAGEKLDAEDRECPESLSACGHHCNHVLTHDACCWCGMSWGEDGVRIPPPPDFAPELGQ